MLKFEKVVINDFIEAWFNNDYEKLPKEDFEIVYAQYIDASGLYNSKEFELTTYINYLKNRIYVLQTVIYSQEIYFEVFGKPYLDGIDFIKERFGFNFIWEDNGDKFISFLRKLKSNERNKSGELKRKEFEFDKLKKEKQSGNVSNVQRRHEFIKMLNSFNKNGYRIDRDKTTVEELALMIKVIQDEAKEYELKNLKIK